MTNDEWMLVGEAKKGDAHAFAKLYQRYYQDLYRFALCYIRNADMAEDAVMNSVLKAYERIGDLRKNTAFKSWLFQITANECRRILNHSPLYLEDVDWIEPQAEEQGYLTPEIRELLDTLSEAERLVVTLSVFSGYSSQELAAILHKRPGSIRSIKSRAMSALREKIEHKASRKEVNINE